MEEIGVAGVEEPAVLGIDGDRGVSPAVAVEGDEEDLGG